MSRPELDIIRSPSAETFLRMVTQGFYNRSAAALWIYEVIGREWDELRVIVEGIQAETQPQTCTWSIEIWEWMYGIESDESLTLEERRQRVLSKILGVRPINPEVLRRRIEAVSGADAEVTDFTAPYSFRVTLNITNKPIPMERVLQYINAQKPAHLTASVEIVFPKIESVLHVGGGAGRESKIGVPLREDTPSFRAEVHTGGVFWTDAEIGVPLGPDSHDFQAEVHAGGAFGADAKIGILADRAPPEIGTAIVRTGGVCTIISRFSGGD